MGFCTDEEYRAFMHDCPWHEAEMIESGIHLVKYWLDVSQEEQTRRFRERRTDPRKLWKLGAIDLEAHRRWWEYTAAKEAMFAATDTDVSPWYVIQSDDKRRARVNCIGHLLSVIPVHRPDRGRGALAAAGPQAQAQGGSAVGASVSVGGIGSG